MGHQYYHQQRKYHIDRNSCKQKKSLVKVKILWEGHKIWKNLSLLPESNSNRWELWKFWIEVGHQYYHQQRKYHIGKNSLKAKEKIRSKLRYYEKATKFEKISPTFFWRWIFVTFSENQNFKPTDYGRPMKPFFHWNSEVLGLGRQLGHHFGKMSPLSMFSTIQPLFLQKK